MLLLNPGPVTLSERVRRSLLNPDLCHREAEFFDLQDELRLGLLAVYDLDPAQWTALKARLEGLIDHEQDSLRYYYLGANWQRRVEQVGAKAVADLNGPLIV